MPAPQEAQTASPVSNVGPLTTRGGVSTYFVTQNLSDSPTDVVARILAEQLETGTGLHDEGIAVFADREDLAVVGPWRRREAAGLHRHALARVDLLAGPCIVAQQDAAVEQRVVVVAVDERRRVVAAEQRLRPDDERIARLAGLERDVARRARPEPGLPSPSTPSRAGSRSDTRSSGPSCWCRS